MLSIHFWWTQGYSKGGFQTVRSLADVSSIYIKNIHFSNVFTLPKNILLEPFRREEVLRTCWNDSLLVLSLTVSKNNGLLDQVQQCSTVFLLVVQRGAHSCAVSRQRCLWRSVAASTWGWSDWFTLRRLKQGFSCFMVLASSSCPVDFFSMSLDFKTYFP